MCIHTGTYSYIKIAKFIHIYVCDHHAISQFKWNLRPFHCQKKKTKKQHQQQCKNEHFFLPFSLSSLGRCFYFDCLQIRGLEKHIGLVAKWNFIASRTRNTILTFIFTLTSYICTYSHIFLRSSLYFLFAQSQLTHINLRNTHLVTL